MVMIKRILGSFPYSATSILLAIADCTLEFFKPQKWISALISYNLFMPDTIEQNVPFIEKMNTYVLL